MGPLVYEATASGQPVTEIAAGIGSQHLGAVATPRAIHRGPGRRAGASDDVDDAANGVGAVEAGTRSLDDLDPLDGFGLDVLQRRPAKGSGVDAHAVEQHSGVITVGAAQEY